MHHRLVTILTFTAWLCCFSAHAESCRTPFMVGLHIVTIGARDAAVWYPTTEKESPYTFSNELTGSVAKDATPSSCQRFPLIVFSHGLGGCGLQTVFMTEQLARAGYIVVAPDHADAICSVRGGLRKGAQGSEASLIQPETWSDATERDRRDDLAQTLDWMINASPWRPAIDSQKIGGIGHSLGGYTLAGMAGAWPNWKDRRLQSAVLLSPYIQPYLKRRLIENITIPLMYQGAQFDVGITPFVNGMNGALSMGSMTKYYAELKGGSHFEWTNLVCLGQPTVQDCLKNKPNARLITLYAGAFLNATLGKQPDGLDKLRGFGLARWEKR